MALSFVAGQFLPAPGHCLSCGNNGVDCIGSGSSKDFYGALLLCLECFRDGALRISELDLFDKTAHNNITAELEEKIEWRNSLEPTINKLESDISRAVYNARHGFNQRYISDTISHEIFGNGRSDDPGVKRDSGDTESIDGQLFFSLEELRDYVSDTGQVDNNVGDERTAGISSSPSYAD